MFNKRILSLIVFLSLSFANATIAQGANSILNTTVKKATDGLNVTFYTKGDPTETPIVKDKGDNHYVILLPNFTDSMSTKPDFRTATDIISDVNVKTINEGAITYTKVSITTKKPIKINAETRKTSQSISELSGVNDIVAKVNLINQDIKTTQVPSAEKIAVESKPTPAPVKMNNVQDILKNKNTLTQTKSSTSKVSQPIKKPEKSIEAHVPTNTKTIKNDVKKLNNENIKNIKQTTPKVQTTQAPVIDKKEPQTKDDTQITLDDNIEILPITNEKINPFQDFNIKDIFSSPFFIIGFFVFCGLMLGLILLRQAQSMLSASEDINSSFVTRMNNINYNNKKKRDLSKIAENKNLTWQEKYASYKADGAIVKQEKPVAPIEIDDDFDIIEEEPEIEITENDIEPLSAMTNPFATAYDKIHNAEDVITHSLKRGIALKKFEEPASLNLTKRNNGITNRFTSFEQDRVKNVTHNLDALLDAVNTLNEDKIVIKPQPAINPQINNPRTNKLPTPQTTSKQITQPIEKKKMKIKESRAIDENKGIYLVDMHDKLALMGRINDKFTVLKKFRNRDMKTLQVRRDKDNLYMVRTDGYKALVDINEEKMGVFAEL